MPATLQQTIQHRMNLIARDNGMLNIVCPAGIGDLAWILCKFLPITRTRRVKFWLPGGNDDQKEQRRCGDYLDLFDLEYDYLKNLTTDWVWDRPGSPSIPKADGAWISVQANRHLEAGKRIENWYPELPTVWPDTKVKPSKHDGDYVIMFACTRNYMGMQLPPRQWGHMAHLISQQVAPVRWIGAWKDIRFLNDILQHCNCKDNIIDQPFGDVLAAMKSPQCKAVVGVASGPLIVNIYEGTAPTLIAYPNHLHDMPGSWESPNSRWHWTPIENMYQWVVNGGVERMAR